MSAHTNSSLVARFVRSKNQSQQEFLEKAMGIIEGTDATGEWFSEEDCLKVKEKNRKFVYIFADFDGPGFRNIIATENRIYGPSCIMTCMQKQKPLPKVQFPVFSLAFEGTSVSCTSIPKSARDAIHQKIEWMFGEVSKDFHDQVTHLVAGEVGSKKYMVAVNCHCKIMSPDWVEAVWKECKTKEVNDASNADPWMKYRCPAFKGLVITASGFNNEDRAEIKKMVEEEGGTYTGEMKVKHCTHLVISAPTGQKYEFAKKWQLHIVKPQWIFDSIASGYCKDERKYALEAPSGKGQACSTSTPNQQRDSRRFSNMSSISDMSAIAVTHVNDTALTNHTTLANQTTTSEYNDPLEQLDVSTANTDMFLDGFKIYLSGFQGNRLEKLRRIINLGGGIRLNQINDTVTHVVIDDVKNNDNIQQIQESSNRPHVVKVEWLLDCFKQNQSLPEEQYYCLDLPPPQQMSPHIKVKKKRPMSTSQRDSESQEENNVTVRENLQDKGDDMEELMSQYLPQAPNDMTDESALMRAVAAVEDGTSKKEVENNPSTSMADDDATLDPNAENEDMEEEEEEGCCFKGKTFVIFGFDAEDENLLSEFIDKDGKGTVLPPTTRSVPDYAVVPVFGCAVNMTVNEIVTNAWLQMCIESDCLLPVEENEMFTPLTVMPDTLPLQGCVLSISGYAGTERDVLNHIAETIGAKCQEYFVKRANKGLEASTHLIVNQASGSKFEAAKKWKLPTVSKYWLFECARTGKKLEESEYLIDNPNGGKPQKQDTSIMQTSWNKDVSVAMETSRSKTSESKGAATGNTSKVESHKPSPDDTTDVTTDVDMEEEKPPSTESSPGTDKENRENQVVKRSDRNSSPVIPMKKTTEQKGTPLINTRVKELIVENKKETPKHQPLDGKAGVDTPGKFLDPNKEFQPRFDLADVMSALESPASQGSSARRKPKPATPLDEVLHRNLSIAIKNTSKPKPLTMESPRLTTTQQTKKVEIKGPLKGVVIAVSKKLSLNQSEYNNIAAALGADYRWTYDQSCTHFIFQGKNNDINKEFRQARDHGKIIVSPTWLHMCQEQNARVDESLFPHTYNPNLSLSISSAKKETPRLTRRSTRLKKNQIDSPQPATPKCPPELKPDTPKRAKESTPARKTRQSEQEPVQNKSTDGDSSENNNSLLEEMDTTQSDNESPDHDKPTGTQNLVKDLKTLMAATTKTYSRSKRRNRTRNDSLDQIDESTEGKRSRPNSRLSWENNKSKDSTDNSAKRMPRTSSRSNLQPPDVHTEPSQVVEVAWDDPWAREQQEILAQELAKNSESLSPGVHCKESLDDQNTSSEVEQDVISFKKPMPSAGHKTAEGDQSTSPEAPSLAFPLPKNSMAAVAQPIDLIQDQEDDNDETMDEGQEEEEEEEEEEEPTKYFLFSGMSQQERVDFGALVEELDGIVLEAAHFDSRCTHLVVGTPTRNEKILACIASGKWLLHKSYFQECRNEGTFVPEIHHEWGSDFTQAILATLPKNVKDLAKSAHRWRLQLSEKRKKNPDCPGAFQNWKVLVLTDPKREDSFKRLLQAGGATVVALKPPFPSLEGITHAFIDLNKLKYELNLKELVEANIHCVKPDYIAQFLMETPTPKPEMYYISEAKKLLSQ